jgi:ATP-dependent Lon protease
MFFGRDEKKELARRADPIPLLPLRDIIVFPHMVVPLFVGRERSIAALKYAMAHKGSTTRRSSCSPRRRRRRPTIPPRTISSTSVRWAT